MTRVLVVNADDFGRSRAVNAGVIAAHESGIVTSASLMVRWPAAAAAAEYARARQTLSVGLHLDLGEWRWAFGEWQPVYEVVPLEDAGAVEEELLLQLTRFVDLLGAAPTHLDSHQHVHRQEPVRSVLARCGDELGVPVRDVTPDASYCGAFYGAGAVDVDSLVALLESLPAGVTELGCHPAIAVDFETDYGRERPLEVETLCDPRVRAALRSFGIELSAP
jgi:chitin disaccharide deacetylase